MYDDDAELDGDDTMGVGADVLGAAKAIVKAAQRGGAALRRPVKPRWRGRQAPGVPMPGYGLVNLPFRPQANGGVFTPAFPVIGYEARAQKPFRGERFIATVRRSAGATGVIIFGNGIFVGTDLQQGQIGAFDVEQFGPTAFDVGMVMVQAEPGVDITLQCNASPVVPAAETVGTAFQILGRYVHG